MNVENLYNSPFVANNIKNYAKTKNVSLKDILENCGLGSNTFSHMLHGRALAFDSLALIADYLDCSVDYLLGRTDIPEINRATSVSEQPALSVRVAAKSGSDYNVHGTGDDTDPVIR